MIQGHNSGQPARPAQPSPNPPESKLKSKKQNPPKTFAQNVSLKTPDLNPIQFLSPLQPQPSPPAPAAQPSPSPASPSPQPPAKPAPDPSPAHSQFQNHKVKNKTFAQNVSLKTFRSKPRTQTLYNFYKPLKPPTLNPQNPKLRRSQI